MTTEMPILTAQPRGVTGKSVKRLRRQGVTPHQLYAPGNPTPSHRVRLEVPIRVVGEAPVVQSQGGTLSLLLHSLEVEALPLEMPRELVADVSGLDDFDKVLRVADLRLPSGARVTADPEQVLVQIVRPILEEKVEEKKEEAAAPVAAGGEAVPRSEGPEKEE